MAMTQPSLKQDRMHFSTRFLPDHLAVQPIEARKALFQASVRSVEIEVSSYCNRTCWFCPNATYSRRAKYYMGDDVYGWIIDSLTRIGYDGVISYSGYTEASHDRSFIERIRFARERLPQAHIFTCSNGDYLTCDYLEELADAGMSQMFVSCYIDDHKPGSYTLTRAQNAINRLQNRLDLLLDYKLVEPTAICAEATNKPMRLTISCRDHSTHANDRGQLVDVTRQVRHEPCSWVFSNVYIDYDGTMKPCANVRADVAAHSDFMYGRIDGPDALFNLYGGEIATEWRRNLVGFGAKGGPCQRCIQGVVPDMKESRAEAERLVSQLVPAGANRP